MLKSSAMTVVAARAMRLPSILRQFQSPIAGHLRHLVSGSLALPRNRIPLGIQSRSFSIIRRFVFLSYEDAHRDYYANDTELSDDEGFPDYSDDDSEDFDEEDDDVDDLYMLKKKKN
ncbi:hypothetical protein Sjap_003020 [Stephania japonica]|uniref:Uncharacterized protein n=1 Tax=Stephania japonica TaxID=461633 RepID=A0AAP0KNV5_9MAGN